MRSTGLGHALVPLARASGYRCRGSFSEEKTLMQLQSEHVCILGTYTAV